MWALVALLDGAKEQVIWRLQTQPAAVGTPSCVGRQTTDLLSTFYPDHPGMASIMSSTVTGDQPVAPQWMHDLMSFRQRLFLAVVEPVITALLGPVKETYGDGLGNVGVGVGVGVGEEGFAGGRASSLKWETPPQTSGGGFVPAVGSYINCDHASSVGLLDGSSLPEPCYYRDDDGGFQFAHSESSHRRLSFLPNYIEDVSAFHETSMSFATLVMLFILMTSLALVLLSCFYHNQKTSPLFISPRRHRLPNLVPPPLPVDRFFSWVRVPVEAVGCAIVYVSSFIYVPTYAY